MAPPKTDMYACPKCKKKYSTQGSLARHIKTTRERGIKCKPLSEAAKTRRRRKQVSMANKKYNEKKNGYKKRYKALMERLKALLRPLYPEVPTAQ